MTTSIPENKDASPIEPAQYFAEFPISVYQQIAAIVFSLGMIAYGFYEFSASKSFSMLVWIFIPGGFLVFLGAVFRLSDRGPRVKLAREGLWTWKLGFKPWSAISKVELRHELRGRYSRTYLDIFLKDSPYNFADHEILFNRLKDGDKIKPMIDELMDRQMLIE